MGRGGLAGRGRGRGEFGVQGRLAAAPISTASRCAASASSLRRGGIDRASVALSRARALSTSTGSPGPISIADLGQAQGVALGAGILFGHGAAGLGAAQLQVVPRHLGGDGDLGEAQVRAGGLGVGAGGGHLVADPAEQVDLPGGVEADVGLSLMFSRRIGREARRLFLAAGVGRVVGYVREQ